MDYYCPEGFHIVEFCWKCGEHEAALEDEMDGLCYTCKFEIDFGKDPFEHVRPTKLTREDAEEIRQEYSEGGITQVELADKWGVSQPLVSMIISRLRWI